ncbi:hypothetical protein [Arenimonas oryziterrae]|uniref:PsiF repeat-containing protein n=1 Tax=Arenimonas oryziterrae DSM 21050 = YC6267 TaxID=1121015 RepID=A0A091BIP6_9GAMM|nr:hypothetical protein [Arenimonas oryziterrae]KFN44215.1 hypothetical protein N789_07295 [Arenimonas oryziterrae DSM 21050 = YC6267]
MNIRNTLAALTLCLASTAAFAASPVAAPAAPAKPATTLASTTHTAALKHAKLNCKKGEAAVKGKCESAKAKS